MDTHKRNGNFHRSRLERLPWKEWAEIASALAAIATFIGVLIHLR